MFLRAASSNLLSGATSVIVIGGCGLKIAPMADNKTVWKLADPLMLLDW